MTQPTTSAPEAPDVSPPQLARAALLLSLAIAVLAVPLALAGAGPDWLHIPIVFFAIASVSVALGALIALFAMGRAPSRRPKRASA